MILIPNAVFILFTLGVLVAGLVAGYAVGSSGPCPDCEGIETSCNHDTYAGICPCNIGKVPRDR